jgi:dihydrofolate reductase
MISLIVAHDNKRGIGINNELPWRMPTDLKRFQQLTTAKIVVMGKNTYESIGRPLPNRVNIVLTRDTSYNPTIDLACAVANNIETVLRINNDNVEIFVIGGSSIYNLFLPYADRLYITEIDHEFQCDAFFPEIGEEWVEISREKHQKDEKNKYDYDFVIYEKVSENNSK